MAPHGFSHYQRARKEARTLLHSDIPNEVPSPWWTPLAQLRRVKLSWFGCFRPRCSKSMSNKPNEPNEPGGADELGGKERVIKGDQNLKSKDKPDVQRSLNTITDPSKQTNTKIRGGGNITDKNNGANGDRFTSLPRRLKIVIESKFRDEEFTAKPPTKNWVSRFRDSQKAINPHRRRKYRTKPPSNNVRKRLLRRLEYKNLGIELSYAAVKTADWKARNCMTMDSRSSAMRKPKPGCSNLRYCLTYLKQVQDTVSGFNSSWNRDHRRWFSRWSTIRAAALCLGV